MRTDGHVGSILVGRLYEDCLGKGGQVLLIEGLLGCGKTTFLVECAERGANSNFLVLAASCSYAERELSFGVLTQLFHAVKSAEGLLPSVDEVESVSRDIRPSVDMDEATVVRLSHRLCMELIELAEHRPLMIAVDDVRHADIPSVRCLLQLMRRLRSAQIVVALTDDQNLRSSYPPLRAELLWRPGLRRVDLSPLSPDATRQMISDRLGVEAEDQLIARFHEVTGGNPLLLRALMDDYVATGEAHEQGYGQAFLSCFYRNEPTLLAVVRGLAVLDHPTKISDLAHVADVDVQSTRQALDAMVAAGLVRDGLFRHEAARAAVLNDLPAPMREDFHRRAARLLHDTGMPATAVARHLVRAGHAVGPWAEDVLLDAAHDAFHSNEPNFAIELLERALRSCAHAEHRAAIQVRLLRLESRINPSTASRHLGPLLAAARSGQLDVHEKITLVQQLLWRGQTGEAKGLLTGLREMPDVEELHHLELWLATTFPSLARRRTVPAGGIGARRGGDDVWARSTAVLADVLIRGHSTETTTRAEKVLREPLFSHYESGQELNEIPALLALIYADHVDTASFWCDQLITEMEPRGLPVLQATVLAAKAEIMLRRGDLSEAADLAQMALRLESLSSWGAFVGYPLSSLILAYTRMGSYEEAARYVSHSAPLPMFKNRFGLHYLCARGHYFLARNRSQAALADFLRCGELLNGWGLSGTSPVPWRAGAAEAWLCLGNRDQARCLLLEQLARSNMDGDRARAQALRLLAETSSAKKRQQLLSEAVGLFEDVGDKYELVRVLRDLGESYHALGDHKRARRVIRRAWHLAKMSDAKPLRDELLPTVDDVEVPTQVPKRSGGIQSLTSSERRVASLAAAGYTNREIALKLYVTASTVEQHLTRVFRKLAVKQREELPVELCVDTPNTT